MKKVGVAILGLGVVGGGTYKILTDKKDYFMKTKNLDVTVESVLERNQDRIKALGIDPSIVAGNIEEVISNPNVDVVVEVMGGIEPAKTFVLKAIMSGKSVVTSNKEMFAKNWQELEAEAEVMNVGLYFEASCVGGVPIIRTLTESLQGDKITSIKGIINGTTNYILTKMSESGASYEEALKEAQRLGYAEANPTADVEGFDAMYKLSILSSLAFKTKVPPEKIYRAGITGIDKEDIAVAKDLGYSVKLLAVGNNTDDGIEVRVNPALVNKSNPLASINDSFNAVQIVGDAVGDVMLTGRGAGALPTGSAIVSDVIFAGGRGFYQGYGKFENDKKSEAKFVEDFTSAYYVKFIASEEAGATAKVLSVFAKHNVNVKLAKEYSADDGKIKIVVITSVCKESSVNKAIDKLTGADGAFKLLSVLKVEN